MSWSFDIQTVYDEETIRKHDKKWIEKNVDWSVVLEREVFSNDFILKYKDVITDWTACCKYQRLKINTIKKLVEYVDWHEIATKQNLTDNFIDKYHQFMKWSEICTYQDISESLIEKYADEIDWHEISYKDYLTLPFIRKYKDKINWRNFSQVYRTYYKNWNFIREFADYLDWEEMYEYIWSKMKRNFKLIREFQDYLPWYQVEEDVIFKKEQIREFWNHLTFIYEEDYYDKKSLREFKEKLIFE